MTDRRIVVTGMGTVTCVGNTLPETWAKLIAGQSGIGRITRFDPAGLPDCAGEVRDPPLSGLNPKEVRRMARYSQLAAAAADEAVRQAGLDPGSEDPVRCGVLIGSSLGGVDEYENGMAALARRGPGGVSPFLIPKFMSNAAAGTLAIRCGFLGPCFDPASACAAGSHAVGEALWMIRRGDADVMLAGGSDACLTRTMMSGFHSLTALSCASGDPARACRPFDRNRDGFVLSEGAGVLVLEELEHARKRGAEILAELAGYGATCDANHITAPDPSGRGLALAMESALRHADCPRDLIGCISAHGTGTVANDRCEAKAIRRVFGDGTDRIKVSALKSMIGHALGGSGAIAAAASVMTLRTGIVPPTINYETPDPECPLDVTPNRAAELDTEAVMITSLGFGGHNAALIFKRWKG